MAYTYNLRTEGTRITEAIYTDDVTANAAALYAGEMSISGQAADLDLYASSTTQLAVARRQLRQDFRGLHLHTSYDDENAKKVVLRTCDEITLHDGTNIADWSNLSADITVSGAGGLDTGSEGASRWYEIYAIRKASDGTRNLLLHRAHDYTLDQSLTATVDGSASLRAATANTMQAQTFVPGLAGPLAMVDCQIKKSGSPTGYIHASLYATSGGLPTSIVAATAISRKIDLSTLPTVATWVRFVFDVPFTLVPATTYAIVLSATNSIDAINYVEWDTDGSSPGYASGSLITYDGVSWTATSGTDTMFRTYVLQNNSALTLPTGYTQYCRIGYVYNDGSSNFLAFSQRDRRTVYDRAYQAVVSTGSDTTTTFVDLAAFLPPVDVIVDDWLLYGSNTGTLLEVLPAVDRKGVYYSVMVGGSYFDCATPLVVDYQHVYYRISANTTTVYLMSFSW